MSDHATPVPPVDEPSGPRETPPPPLPTRSRRVGRAAWLTGKGVLGLAVAAVAAGLVSVMSVDLGPTLRARAEQEASKLLRRPMHIGRLSVRLLTGAFVLDDIVIEGLTPESTPFLRARTITVDLPWWSIVTGELLIEDVAMRDWTMIIETFPDGRHNFPHIPRPAPSTGPRRFVTTLRQFEGTGGNVQYTDHGLPWSIDTGPLEVTIARADRYRGTLAFRDGDLRIQQYEPMWAHMQSSFFIDGGLLTLDRLAIQTDGATTTGTGVLDMGRWPAQEYQLTSDLDLSRMRALFFAGRDFSLTGEARFQGTFELDRMFRELKGSFESREAALNAYRFDDLRGSVVWDRDSLDVVDTTSTFLGGDLDLTYRMAPLGGPTPSRQRLETHYRDVDLALLSDKVVLEGMRVQGRATGRNLLEFPTGRFDQRTGDGEVQVDGPEGLPMQGRELTGLPVPPRAEPLDRDAPLGTVPVSGEARYSYDGDWLRIARGYAATPDTYVDFAGETAYGTQSAMAFHVTSRDWQESDRLLAGIMTAVGARTRPIEVGGIGIFDGRLTGAFANPRIEGQFDGDELAAWNVRWGRARGDLVVENGYVDIREAEIERDDARMVVNGRFSLGFPRRDGGEEIDARIQALAWPVVDLRRAFDIADYPVDGALSGDFHVYGKYLTPFGFGRMTIADGTAYSEAFDRATAALRFEGEGVRLDAIEMAKGPGRVTGAAYVGWAGTYSFAVDGRSVPVETIRVMTFDGVPLTGRLRFGASGSGRFETPRYEVRLAIDDFYLADEGIGQVAGRLSIRDGQLFIEQLEAASSRLAMSGAGRIDLDDDDSNADLTFTLANTSLDPYLRVFAPDVSPFASMVGSGTMRIVGPLTRQDRLRGEVRLDTLQARLFDYAIANDGPLRLVLEQQRLAIDRLRLVGEGTSIEVAGDARLDTEQLSIRLLGDANLGLLQGFLRDIRASGAAEVQAEMSGTLSEPLLAGTALITDGRLRYGALPHAVDAISGLLRFDTTGASLDGLTARLGGGPVQFGGRVTFDGLAPTVCNLTATGYEMRLRYPEGIRSVIDADLALRGPVAQPTLSGTVDVRDALLSRTIDTTGAGMFGSGAAAVPAPALTTDTAFPLRFDVRITAPSTFRVENNTTRLVSRADLTLRGTYDRPQLFGRAEIERGEVFFEGKRYTVTRGAIDFSNPTRIEPFFDIEAETRAQVPGQIYRVVFRVSGTPDRFVFDLSSDPPLSSVDILALLFGDVRDPQNAELRALRTPNQTEQDLIAARAARLLASPISSNVGRVAEQALGVDSVQITPSLGDFSSQQSSRLNPGARLTIGKRISDRLYVSYTQLLTSSQRDQLILVEYTQSDRLSWIVSQNEDDTYAVDVRLRHVF